ncbi:CPBP family intramembrane glutamic endopeptidase [Ornithinibacillus halotolerans]|nr:CPBP family intramembrane glutamic endopeptidase [Ornithinibacillus halotolerans]
MNIGIVFVQMLGVALLSHIVFNTIQRVLEIELTFFMWVTIYLLCLYILVRSLRINDISPKDVFGDFSVKNVPWTTLICIKILLILFSWLSQSAGMPLISMVEPDVYKEVYAIYNEQADSTVINFNVIMMLIISFTLVPIVEEFLFRGYLLNKWGAKLGIGKAIIISSLLFAFLHFDILVFLAYFANGIFYSLVYLKTKKLIVPIILHSLTNLISSLSNFSPGLSIGSIEQLELAAIVNTIIYLILIPIIAFILFRFYKRHALTLPYPSK